MSKKTARFIVPGLLVLMLQACSFKQHDEINDQDATALSKEAWVSKAKQVLHYGQGLSSDENLIELSRPSHDEILETFFTHPRFADMVLDFNLYFLGQRTDHFYKLSETEDRIIYSSQVLEKASAVNSARETFKKSGGDYLSLLNWRQPLYLSPNSEPVAFLDFFPEADKIPFPSELVTWSQKRHFVLQRYLKRIEDAVTFTQGLKFPEQKAEYCNFEKIKIRGFYIQMPFFSANIGDYFYFEALFALEKPISEYCSDDSAVSEEDFPDKITPIRRLGQTIAQIFADAESRDPEQYPVRALTDIRSLNAEDYNFPQIDLTLPPSFWFDFQNSSTNLNRKRAKYFLSRYFCDDLTPIGFVSPEVHAQEEHGSNPSCLSCHYKLDPIAGFFRYLGSSGRDHSRRSKITFDDGGKVPLSEYLNHWGPTPSGRQNNIGYIRSQTDESLNSYGSSPEDLYSIMRNAPEVKACIVKRLSEYVLGEEQQVDSSFLNSLTQNFIRESRDDSGRAFKNTLKRLLTSKAFTRQFADSEQCYDLPPGESSVQRPPCQIAYILQKNCVVCHSKVSGPGRLDLSRWDKFFPHLDERGKKISSQETFKRMLERISTPDKNRQMPPQRHFASKERETLFLWLQKRLEE